MSKELVIKIKSEADANQLASLVDSYNVTQLISDRGQGFHVGNTAIFWLYEKTYGYSQFTARANEVTLNILEETSGIQYSTVNQLAEALAEIN